MVLSSRVGQPLWTFFEWDRSIPLGEIAEKDKQWDQVPLSRYFRHLKADAPAYQSVQHSQSESVMLKSIVEIINDCTHPDPGKRPEASKVVERLRSVRQSPSIE
ncbi:protein kinase family protein [Endozoicomonas numazuensis]|uniref:Protein kinase domain-containing protein n=1 Tax=Endozoicomonas numazuensis TaxID=1137799 RepID=A0A081NM02_9GAMM|nr:hypothetical protein [Endozoicomonas numazuensis]KEQ19475.1 hypothetical protein GZ78_05955 [Endozoicomonas numazuensis]